MANSLSKTSKTIQPVIQQEAAGCGIACAAALANLSYPQAKQIANQHGIYADNEQLWSDPKVLTTLLSKLNISTASTPSPFASWSALPDCALLALKWHQINKTAYWHWAIFIREHNEKHYVLDSKASLKQHRRTDFGRMKPKWFIEVYR